MDLKGRWKVSGKVDEELKKGLRDGLIWWIYRMCVSVSVTPSMLCTGGGRERRGNVELGCGDIVGG